MADIALARRPSIGEEIANSLSHGFGFAAALALSPTLLLNGVKQGGWIGLVGSAVFASTLSFLCLASTLYHAIPVQRARGVLQLIDHIAIYLLIAGTYTPFTLGPFRGAWGWTLLATVWALAAIGIALKLFHGNRYPGISLGLYLGMGWLAATAVWPLGLSLPTAGWLWLLGGGLAYTLGVFFFALDHRLRYAHFIWHLFVLAGAGCHAYAVLYYSV